MTEDGSWADESEWTAVDEEFGDEVPRSANASGGVYYPIHRLEDLKRAYNDVVAQLRTAYTITYASNSEPSQRRVKVRANRDGASRLRQKR